MNLFQVVGESLLLAALLATWRGAATGRMPRRAALSWSLLWVSAAILLWQPELSSDVARFLGIRRGADLVSYIAILCSSVAFFVLYLRLRRIEAALTKVVRELALRDANISDENVSS